MTLLAGVLPESITISGRAEAIYSEQVLADTRGVDRLFAVLLPLQWVAAVMVAVSSNPFGGAGSIQQIPVNVWAALVLGGATVSLPTLLTVIRPGRGSTRICVAVAQMLIGALLIHLSGGRLETHFHVFGSLAFLALYRDWRVLAVSGLVVASDHFLRGIYWPRSVFGMSAIQPWRWAEHAAWVLFEGGVLFLGINRSLGLNWVAAQRQAVVEERTAELARARAELEVRVVERTSDLARANESLRGEIVERCRAEGEALQSREIAEEATRSKSEFLANMSHEIRTPMHAIMGMTDVTLGQSLTPPQRENLQVVKEAADALLGLIDDILDFSKIEAGKLELDPVAFRPRETIEAILKILGIRASEKGIKLSGVVDPDVPQVVVGDPLRLRQVLMNLVGNAIKFTDRGQVQIKVSSEASESGTLMLHCQVIDNGIGIPASRLAMIFDPFRQAESSTSRRFGGTGLGLSISSKLVELMDGRIWVESEPGQGSNFHFTARMVEAPESSITPNGGSSNGQEPEDGRRLRILLVDDNQFNRMVGSRLLERLGHEIDLAEDGTDAVRRYESGGPYDLVMMDLQMPGMDGFETTAVIREIQAGRGHRVPVLAVTACAMKGDRERCLAGGMDGHLSKPIRDIELRRAISLVTASDPASAQAEAGCPWTIDPATIRAALPVDREALDEIVRSFQMSCVEQIARMWEAIRFDSPIRLASTAHALLGCLGMFASEATVAVATELLIQGQTGKLDESSMTLDRLEIAIEAIQPVLNTLLVPSNDAEQRSDVLEHASS